MIESPCGVGPRRTQPAAVVADGDLRGRQPDPAVDVDAARSRVPDPRWSSPVARCGTARPRPRARPGLPLVQRDVHGDAGGLGRVPGHRAEGGAEAGGLPDPGPQGRHRPAYLADDARDAGAQALDADRLLPVRWGRRRERRQEVAERGRCPGPGCRASRGQPPALERRGPVTEPGEEQRRVEVDRCRLEPWHERGPGGSGRAGRRPSARRAGRRRRRRSPRPRPAAVRTRCPPRSRAASRHRARGRRRPGAGRSGPPTWRRAVSGPGRWGRTARGGGRQLVAYPVEDRAPERRGSRLEPNPVGDLDRSRISAGCRGTAPAGPGRDGAAPGAGTGRSGRTRWPPGWRWSGPGTAACSARRRAGNVPAAPVRPHVRAVAAPRHTPRRRPAVNSPTTRGTGDGGGVVERGQTGPTASGSATVVEPHREPQVHLDELADRPDPPMTTGRRGPGRRCSHSAWASRT